MTTALIVFIIACGAVFAYFLLGDIISHWSEMLAERGKIPYLGAFSVFVWFFASLGVSDVALNTPVYRKFRLVGDDRLPGTLIAGGVINSVIISALYLSGGKVDVMTLIPCAVIEALGTVIGVRIVSKLNGAVIRVVMGIAMIASIVILLIKTFLIGGGGTATGIYGVQFAIALPVMLLLGILNMMGVGMKAPSMAMFLLMGMDSMSVLTLVLTVGVAGGVMGGIQYVRLGRYQRKAAFSAMAFGFIGVVIGAFFVKSLNTSVLQWVMIAILAYTSYTMLVPKKVRFK